MPRDERNLAVLVAQFHGKVHRAEELKATTTADLLHAVDAYRKPDRFREFLQACASDFHGRPGYVERSYPPVERLERALDAAQSVDAGAIAMALRDEIADDSILPAAINAKVREARISQIKHALNQMN